MAVVAAGRQPGELLHIPTPWARFNAKYGGIELDVATVFMGHSGEGKSAGTRSLAVGSARAGVATLWLSCEDPHVKTLDRCLAAETGIPTLQLNRKEVDPGEVARLRAAVSSFPPNLLLVSESLSSDEAYDKIEKWVVWKREKLGPLAPLAVFVDYLQALVSTDAPEQELSTFTKKCNALARRYHVAIVIGSQVRSDALTEAKRRLHAAKPPAQCPNNWRDFAAYFRPGKGDVEYCRHVEKAAKAMWVWFRPGRWARDLCNWEVPDNEVEIHVVKANFNQEGSGVLKWDGATQNVYEG